MSTQTAVVQPDRSEAVRRGRALAMIATSVFLVVAGTAGVITEEQGLIWPDRLLNHPFLFGCAAALLGGFGLASLARRQWLVAWLRFVALMIAVAWALLGVVAPWWYGAERVDQVTAPDGAVVVVVEEGVDVIDPVWHITLEERGGLLARRWEIGCVSGDANWLRGVEWRDDGVLIVRTDNGTALVGVDPRTGRPTRGSGPVWGC